MLRPQFLLAYELGWTVVLRYW